MPDLSEISDLGQIKMTFYGAKTTI